MSDQWGQTGASEGDPPIAGSPAAKPAQASGPGASPSAILDEFSRWLEHWAAYARAHLAQNAGDGGGQPAARDGQSSPVNRQPAKGPPEHWQVAATQGPPAHWLALFSSQPAQALPAGQGGELPGTPPAGQPPELAEAPDEVIRRFQAELAGFLGRSSPDFIPSHSRSSGVHGTGSPAGPENLAEPAGATFQPAGPVLGEAEPVSGLAEPDSPGPETPPVGSQPGETPPGQAANGPEPVHITRFRIRSPAPVPAPVTVPASGPPLAGQAGSPGYDDLSPEGGSGRTQPAQPAPVPQAAAETPPDRPRVTRLFLSGLRQPARVDVGQQASQVVDFTRQDLRAGPAASRAESPEASGAVFQSLAAPADQPDGFVSASLPMESPTLEPVRAPSLAVESNAFGPAWPEPSGQFEALPVRWPATSNDFHWPDLPEPRPLSDLGPRPSQNPDRRRRIDREQGGSAWNG